MAIDSVYVYWTRNRRERDFLSLTGCRLGWLGGWADYSLVAQENGGLLATNNLAVPKELYALRKQERRQRYSALHTGLKSGTLMDNEIWPFGLILVGWGLFLADFDCFDQFCPNFIKVLQFWSTLTNFDKVWPILKNCVFDQLLSILTNIDNFNWFWYFWRILIIVW